VSSRTSTREPPEPTAPGEQPSELVRHRDAHDALTAARIEDYGVKRMKRSACSRLAHVRDRSPVAHCRVGGAGQQIGRAGPGIPPQPSERRLFAAVMPEKKTAAPAIMVMPTVSAAIPATSRLKPHPCRFACHVCFTRISMLASRYQAVYTDDSGRLAQATVCSALPNFPCGPNGMAPHGRLRTVSTLPYQRRSNWYSSSTSTSGHNPASFFLCTSIPAIRYGISSSWRERRACRRLH